jgi:hypothetical protein
MNNLESAAYNATVEPAYYVIFSSAGKSFILQNMGQVLGILPELQQSDMVTIRKIYGRNQAFRIVCAEETYRQLLNQSSDTITILPPFEAAYYGVQGTPYTPYQVQQTPGTGCMMMSDAGMYVYLSAVEDIVNVIREIPAFNQLSLFFHIRAQEAECRIRATDARGKVLAGQYGDKLKLLPHITEGQPYAAQGINTNNTSKRIPVVERVR